jgi:nucleoside-diphosphate kinase
MEKTFAIIKPDAVAANQAGAILAEIQKAGFRIAGMKMKRLSQLEAENFYGVHKERPFYGSLVKFMTEGPVVVLALEAPDAIQKWRDTMGATNPANQSRECRRRHHSQNVRHQHRAQLRAWIGRAGNSGSRNPVLLRVF